MARLPKGLTRRFAHCPLPRAPVFFPWRLSRWARWRPAFSALVFFTLFCSVPVFPAPPLSAQPRAFAVAVMPFENRREREGGEDWLGHFLRDRIVTAFLHRPRVAVMEAGTAGYWRRRLGLSGLAAPTRKQLDAMGVDAIVVGTTQRVMRLTEVRLGVWFPGAAPATLLLLTFRFQPAREDPGELLSRVFAALQKTLAFKQPLDRRDITGHIPQKWDDVRAVYSLLSQPRNKVTGKDTGKSTRKTAGKDTGKDTLTSRPERIAKLTRLAQTPGLRGRVGEALARLYLEQALLFHPKGTLRRTLLLKARGFIHAAYRRDPDHSGRQALKGEIHFFLNENFQAHSDVSMARFKNPLNALAFAVLALNAGLSTGASNQYMGRALEIAPNLDPSRRGPADPAFQGGIFDPLIAKWRKLKASKGLIAPSGYRNLVTEAIAYFENEQWEEAQDKFMEAAGKEQEDYLPFLYLGRILIRTGRHADAIPTLRRLAQDNPQEAEIHHFLGLAQEKNGEFDAARKAYRTALVENEKDYESLYRLAKIDMAEKKWETAQNTLRKLMRLDPEKARTWATLGTVRIELKDTPGARSAFARALELEADNAEAKRGLESLKGR
ncbi:MAG: tetratricopeptide repeat protein [SAR324 cluster bacterium]|nr:tetratricopeptide repeat protein [SAR324 cluster bacterium]